MLNIAAFSVHYKKTGKCDLPLLGYFDQPHRETIVFSSKNMVLNLFMCLKAPMLLEGAA
jgi:hypothetical protein